MLQEVWWTRVKQKVELDPLLDFWLLGFLERKLDEVPFGLIQQGPHALKKEYIHQIAQHSFLMPLMLRDAEYSFSLCKYRSECPC